MAGKENQNEVEEHLKLFKQQTVSSTKHCKRYHYFSNCNCNFYPIKLKHHKQIQKFSGLTNHPRTNLQFTSIRVNFQKETFDIKFNIISLIPLTKLCCLCKLLRVDKKCCLKPIRVASQIHCSKTFAERKKPHPIFELNII